MEALVQEKILSSFVNEVSVESAIVQPINVNIKTTNVTRMIQNHTMTTNDGNYFIRYGGFYTSGNYNAIEVYSINSLDNNKEIYIFDNMQIENHTFQVIDLKQSTDGRFYAIGRYYTGGSNVYYLIIFNNFIQDGYCQINKYYTTTQMGVVLNSGENLNKVTKKEDTGLYFIATNERLIRFEINLLEGNKTRIATVVEGGTITSGDYETQLNILRDKLILTKLWNVEIIPSGSTPYTKYEYSKAVIDVNEELPSTVTLQVINTTNVYSDIYIGGAINNPYEAIIPSMISGSYLGIKRINLDGTSVYETNYTIRFSPTTRKKLYIEGDYVSVTDETNLYLFYRQNDGTDNLQNFYITPFTQNFINYKILKQYNMINLIGIAVNEAQQSIVSIKNIYSPNVTSEPYFDYDFCVPYYMNLYSNSNDNTSLIFSRDATARFYSGNQITNTFIVPNYLLNDGNIEKASVYGKTNYLLNNKVEDFEKNKFESLYFNFIYNLNVIDNTNGLNTLNQIGSNKVANGLWKTFDNYDLRLTKARITYEDSSTEIINLNIPTVAGNNVTFNFEVTGNVIKIEYLSNDESAAYSTFRTNLTGTNTITQTIRVE